MIDKLKPKYLETSKDGRSKSSEELIDALNINVTGDSSGGQGVIKNIKGTNAVVMSLPENQMPLGNNVCIGSVGDEALGVVYFFVYNDQENHGVYAYSSKTNTYRLIFMDASLNFKENSFVKADVLRVRKPEEELASLENTEGDVDDVGDETDEGDVDEGLGLLEFDPCSIPEFLDADGVVSTMLILQNSALVPEGMDINDIIALVGTQCNIG
jgi:hypothetical protein